MNGGSSVVFTHTPLIYLFYPTHLQGSFSFGALSSFYCCLGVAASFSSSSPAVLLQWLILPLCLLAIHFPFKIQLRLGINRRVETRLAGKLT